MTIKDNDEIRARDADNDASTPDGFYEKTFVIMGQTWVNDGADYDHSGNQALVEAEMRQVGLQLWHSAVNFVEAYQNNDGESVDLVYQAQARPI